MSVVFVFSWDYSIYQEKLKTMLMQNLGRQTKNIMVFSEVAYGAIDSVTLDDNGGASSSLKRRRRKDKAASPDRRPKEVLNKPGKAADKTKTKKALSTPHSPQTRAKQTRLFARKKAGKPPL